MIFLTESTKADRRNIEKSTGTVERYDHRSRRSELHFRPSSCIKNSHGKQWGRREANSEKIRLRSCWLVYCEYTARF